MPQMMHKTPRQNTKSTPRVCGSDDIKPFLKQIGKIVTEECQKYDSADDMPWYKTWESWNIQDLLAAKSFNSITTIFCPDISYTQRTIKAVVNRCIEEIPPIESYIQIIHLSEKLVTWKSCVGDIKIFKSTKNKISRKTNAVNCINPPTQKY